MKRWEAILWTVGLECAYFTDGARTLRDIIAAGEQVRRRYDMAERKRPKPKDPAAVKRGKSSKRKGKRVEKLWGEFVCGLAGGTFIRRGHDQSHKDDEFFGNCFEGVLHSEVKGRAAFSFVRYCKQAEADAAQHGLPRWVVAAKADREPFYVITDARDYVLDMVELAERRAKDEDAQG